MGNSICGRFESVGGTRGRAIRAPGTGKQVKDERGNSTEQMTAEADGVADIRIKGKKGAVGEQPRQKDNHCE